MTTTPSPDAERAPVDLDEDERIEAAMTPGPWEHDGTCIESLRTCSCVVHNVENGTGIEGQLDADVAGIVHMRNAFPALLAELRAARAELDRWRHGRPIEGDHVCPDSLALTEARGRIAALVAALDEAADIAARGERACLDHIDRWRALAHPTEGDPAP